MFLQGNGVLSSLAFSHPHITLKSHKKIKKYQKERAIIYCFMLTDSNVSTLHGEKVQATLKGMGLKVDLLDFPAGEASKNIQTILPIINNMIDLGADRTSALIALGGASWVILPALSPRST